MWQPSEKTLLSPPFLQLYHFPQHWISLLSSNRYDAYKLGNTHALKLEASTSKCAAIYVKQKMCCVSAAEKGNSFQKLWWKAVCRTCIYSILLYRFGTYPSDFLLKNVLSLLVWIKSLRWLPIISIFIIQLSALFCIFKCLFKFIEVAREKNRTLSAPLFS